MARETLVTYDALVEASRLLKNRGNIWVVLGRQNAWTDEDVPDSPTPGTHDIEEPFVAIRAQTASMAREVSLEDYNLLSAANRAIGFSETGYVYLELVPDVDADTKIARLIYVEAVYAPFQGMPEADFRIYGAYSRLQPAAGYENHDWVAAPTHVEDFGLLLNLSHGRAYTQVESGRAVTIPLLIELKGY